MIVHPEKKTVDIEDEKTKEGEDSGEDDDILILANEKSNLLARISPIYNARMPLVRKAKDYYKNK